MNTKKDLKRIRVKQYFIEAAKEIIINEGSEQVTVRKIAEKTGYTYPTIYHYFSDQNDLMWDVKKVMVQEMAVILQDNVSKITDTGVARVRKIFRIYIEYFFQNPNMFKFFYYHQFSKPDGLTDEVEYNLDFGAMWLDTFKDLVIEGKLNVQDVPVVAKTIIYAIHGMITLSFSNDGLTEQSVYEELDMIINHLLKIN